MMKIDREKSKMSLLPGYKCSFGTVNVFHK